MPTVELESIMLDGGTQIRQQLNFVVIAEYSDGMKEDQSFPPVTLFYDGSQYWVGDGFHRIRAAKDAGLESINAEVKEGDKRDALLYACGANSEHGLRRTDDDKRNAVTIMLKDASWSQWSDREIARRCQVHHQLVGKLRKQIILDESSSMTADRKFIHHKTGEPATMNTANIGQANGNDNSSDELSLFNSPIPEKEKDPSENKPKPEYGIDRCVLIDPFYAPPKAIKAAIDYLQGWYDKKIEGENET